MANFTESATLILRDKSTANINKVTAALKRLFNTAQKMKRMQLGLDLKKLNQAQSKIKAIARDVSSLQRRRASIQVNTQQLVTAQRQLARLRAQAARPITQRLGTTGGFGGGATGAGGGRQGRQGGPGGVIGAQRNVSVLNASFAQLAATSLKLNAVFGAMAVARAGVKEGTEATLGAEAAAIRIRQAGFTPAEQEQFTALSRQVQEKFPQIPAAEILNASVEQLSALKIANASTQDYVIAMERVARNSQLLAVTYADTAKGAEAARQGERFSQILGKDINDVEIRKVQDAAMRAIIASGGEMSMEEAVRTIQQLTPAIAKSMSEQALTDLLLTREEGGRASTAEWRTAVQELMRDSLNPDDKQAMANLGLRRPSGGADMGIVQEASSNFIDFTRDKIIPILSKAGMADATSAEIGAWLDEFAGFTMTGARAYADAAISLREGETQRQREAARRVNLDPRIADKTFSGATREMVASYDTAIARNLDKFGPVFAAGIQPFTTAIDNAGKLAEQGNLVGAADTMANAAIDVARSKVGTTTAALSLMTGLRTMVDPLASPFEKAVGAFQSAASALLIGVNRIFGETDIVPEEAAKEPVTAADVAARRTAMAEQYGIYGAGKVAPPPIPTPRPGGELDTYIRQVQEKHKIAVDAIIGPDTTAALVAEGKAITSAWAGFMQYAQDSIQAATENVAAGVTPPAAPGVPGAPITAPEGPISAALDMYTQAKQKLGQVWDIFSGPVTTVTTALNNLSGAANQAADALIWIGRKLGFVEEAEQFGPPVPADLVPAWQKLTEQQKTNSERLATDIMQVRKEMELVTQPKPGEGAIVEPTGPVPEASPTIQKMLDGMDMGANKVGQAFDTGTTNLASATVTGANTMQTGITTGGQTAGQTIAAAMISASTTVGNTIAAAVRNATANVTVNVNQPSVDTGGQVA